jgi:hypothetical protein
LFYGLVSVGAIAKQEAAYRRLGRVMRVLREEGTVPWDWLVDHTRSVFEPRSWDGVESVLRAAAQFYRRDLMRDQPVAIQVWAESDSIGSVVAQVADRYCIPTFIGRGYSARGLSLERRPRCDWRLPGGQASSHPAHRRPRPIRGGNLS